jgi:hypothetical protein
MVGLANTIRNCSDYIEIENYEIETTIEYTSFCILNQLQIN